MFEVFFRRSQYGRWEAIETQQVRPQEWFTSASAFEIAVPYMRKHPTLLGLLEQEASDSSRSKDAIGVWAAESASEATNVVATPSGEIHWGTYTYSDPMRPTVTAWHEKGGFFVALPGDAREIQVRWFMPPDQDLFTFEQRAGFHRPGVQETILDWRAYAGEHCAIVDGWARMKRRGEWFITTIQTRAAFFMGQVLRRRVVQKVKQLAHDPAWKIRLTEQEAAHPNIANTFRALTPKLPPQVVDRAIIFVHGTASCGIGCLTPLLAAGNWNGAPIFRFEHDTFQSIATNANALINLISAKLPTEKLLLVAHSRGGLVAKMAAAMFQQSGNRHGTIDIITLGTPHQGTPLVEQSEWILNNLSRLGVIHGSRPLMPSLSPKLKALTYLVQSSRLPLGLEEMRPNGSMLKALDVICAGVEPRSRSWGSSFHINGPHSGYGVMVDSLLYGAFGDQPNDLVVPTASAQGFGAVQANLNCSHSGYLADGLIQSTMAAF